MVEETEGKKIEVSGACMGCGTCEGIAGDYFKVEDDGVCHVIKEYSEEDADKIQEAIDSCPAQAITLK